MTAILIPFYDCLSISHGAHDAKNARHSPCVNPPIGYAFFLTRHGTPCGNYGWSPPWISAMLLQYANQGYQVNVAEAAVRYLLGVTRNPQQPHHQAVRQDGGRQERRCGARGLGSAGRLQS
jgi:hypothetical protein